MSASQHKEEAIREAFIGGIVSNEIMQRLLEDNNLSLHDTSFATRSLESTHRNVELFSVNALRGPLVFQAEAVSSTLKT